MEKEQQHPKTVKEAVSIILEGLSDKDKNLVKNTPKDKLIRFHHGWGTGIRNAFGLWHGNDSLLKDAGPGLIQTVLLW